MCVFTYEEINIMFYILNSSLNRVYHMINCQHLRMKKGKLDQEHLHFPHSRQGVDWLEETRTKGTQEGCHTATLYDRMRGYVNSNDIVASVGCRCVVITVAQTRRVRRLLLK